MNIILHEPETLKEKKELAKQLAEIHAESIWRFLENLECPVEQKVLIVENIKLRFM